MAETCEQVGALGYQGLEIAPFTLSEDPAALTREERERIRETIASRELEFVGFHWLLAAPEGLHATSRDERVRKRTWDYVHSLIDLCADLADTAASGKSVMVFGSPKQRSTVDGMTPREAVDVLTHGLAHAAPHAESRGVTVLIEALSPDQTDVVTCLADAVAIVRQIRSAAIQTMFDTHNAKSESEPHAELLRKYSAYIHHIHVNELDGREPGTGGYDFQTLLTTLKELNYPGWVSVEPFDFSRDASQVAARAIHSLKGAPPVAASQAI
ncbi:MAG TPA: sugar phosphate isomerase/epimerase family protein [Bryobacteraceae bacterium]|nr:sugar phosphate isomerase/epimerase family protein [Bryobacteraceae bacterium]